MNRLAPADHAEKQMYELGKMDERNEVIKLCKSRICFDFDEGKCDHGNCWELHRLIESLRLK
jgi:hypothetical protein